MGSLNTQFELARLVRPNIRRLQPYTSARQSGLTGLRLDANESPFENRWHGVDLNRYPDPNQKELRKSLASYTGLNPEQILAGSGSDEVIDWILKVFCEPGKDLIAAASPSYGMYRVQADIAAVEILDFPMQEEKDFAFRARDFLQNPDPAVKVLFLCSPNNPTGNSLDRREILELCRGWHGIVVVDEAYIEFSRFPSLAPDLEGHPNLVLMRTFSKAFGHAGIRLGYALANPAIIRYFSAVKAPYNVNTLSLQLAVRAVADVATMQGNARLLRHERTRLARELGRLPDVSKVFPSQANFLLFRCRKAAEVCNQLRARGILIRDRTTQVADCLRVTVGTPEENDRFLGGIAAILESDR